LTVILGVCGITPVKSDYRRGKKIFIPGAFGFSWGRGWPPAS
jgi:hypothetical protein